MAARHPRVAAAVSAEGWKLGDFYATYLTLLITPLISEMSHGGEPDTDKRIRQNVGFYDKRKARVIELIKKMNPLTGLEEKKN